MKSNITFVCSIVFSFQHSQHSPRTDCHNHHHNHNHHWNTTSVYDVIICPITRVTHFTAQSALLCTISCNFSDQYRQSGENSYSLVTLSHDMSWRPLSRASSVNIVSRLQTGLPCFDCWWREGILFYLGPTRPQIQSVPEVLLQE